MSLLGAQRDGSGPLLVWLHGFTQTGRSAHDFQSILTRDLELLTIDLPGHGDNAGIVADLDATADLLADVLPSTPFVLGGYSYGGRVALHFALHYAQRLRGLVLLSTTLGIGDPEERDARQSRDEVLADHIELIGAEAFLTEWLQQPLFATLPRDDGERSRRSTDAKGLANSLRSSGTGTQAFLQYAARNLHVPTLLLAGAQDEKFLREASLLQETLPQAAFHVVDKAGHAAHVARPHVVASLVSGFVTSIG